MILYAWLDSGFNFDLIVVPVVAALGVGIWMGLR
jgi:hypothetical protein